MPEKSRSKRDSDALVADQMTRHGELFYKVAYRILRDAWAAEDACQEAAVNALPRSDQVRDDNSLRSWLVKSVVNVSLRSRERRKLEEKTLAERMPPPGVAEHENVQQERREAVMAALEKLDEPVRHVVVMRLLDGMSGREVANALGCSEAQVSQQLRRGVAVLRVALNDWKTAFDRNTKIW